MSNGWAPTSGEQMISDIYQRLRILGRHRHPNNFGEAPGAIDASGGIDISPATDVYVEGELDAFPSAFPPIVGTPPPSGSDAGPVPAASVSTLGTVRGVTRAEITATVHTTGGGESVLVPDQWRFTDLDHTSGADVGADSVVNKRIVVNNPGWYEVMLYTSIDWPSNVPWVVGVLDWASNVGDFQPVVTVYSATSTLLTSLSSRKFWLDSGGWITCAFDWGATTAPTTVVAAIDVTRIA